MKVSSYPNSVRQDLSLKRSLIRLNRDLEAVVHKIDSKEYDRYFYTRSHRAYLGELTNIQMAVLFLEDRRFLVHRGFELRAPLRLARRFLSGKRAGAVSTIDQQLVRIATGRYERTLRRKAREALLAFLLNFHRSKAGIFHANLHDSYFGYKLEGCEVTAKFLFSKAAIALNPDEACFIASLLARPLPKVIFEAVEVEKKFMEITPERIVYLAELQGLDWAERILDRYQYARRMFPSIPNSLRMR